MIELIIQAAIAFTIVVVCTLFLITSSILLVMAWDDLKRSRALTQRFK